MIKEAKQRFEELEWHDAVLLTMEIDRRSPGERDEVVLIVEWGDARRQTVRFKDCYALDTQMNFGVAAPESIRSVRCESDSPRLAEIRRQWVALGVALDDLRCFELITNSTASVIRIFAQRLEVADS